MVDPLTNGMKPESGSRWREHCTHVWVTARWAVVSTIATGYEPVDLTADLLPISADGAQASALSTSTSTFAVRADFSPIAL